LGLVVAGGVDGQFAEEFAGGGGGLGALQPEVGPVVCSFRTRNRHGSVTTGVPEDPRQKFPEAVSDPGSGVRSRGETSTRAARGEGIVIMKLTTMTQVTVEPFASPTTDEDRNDDRFDDNRWNQSLPIRGRCPDHN
jgi:hypothetical protein